MTNHLPRQGNWVLISKNQKLKSQDIKKRSILNKYFNSMQSKTILLEWKRVFKELNINHKLSTIKNLCISSSNMTYFQNKQSNRKNFKIHMLESVQVLETSTLLNLCSFCKNCLKYYFWLLNYLWNKKNKWWLVRCYLDKNQRFCIIHFILYRNQIFE